MGVESEPLVPGVQDGGEPDRGFELGAGDLDEGLGAGLEEEGQAHLGRPAGLMRAMNGTG